MKKYDVDDGKTIYSDYEFPEALNHFFYKVVPSLNIPKFKFFPMGIENLHLIMSVIKSFDKHPSIVKIKADSTFHFRKTSCNEVEKIISNLSIKKSCQQEDLIPKFIAQNFNSCIDEDEFPAELKHADIVPIHKKKDKSDKRNYRPVIILSNYSKVCEKLIYNQFYQYFENIPFPNKCEFRKGYSKHHCQIEIFSKSTVRQSFQPK